MPEMVFCVEFAAMIRVNEFEVEEENENEETKNQFLGPIESDL